MRTKLLVGLAVIVGVAAAEQRVTTQAEADAALQERARAALRKAVEFYRTKVSTGGGYHFAYAEDLSYGRSEMSDGPTRLEIQRDGTPLVALVAYLEVLAGSDLIVTLGGKPLAMKENETLEVFAGREPPRQRIISSRTFAQNVGLLSACPARR